MHMNMPRAIAAAGASLCLASGRAEPESPDTSSLELLRAVRGVRLAAIECGVQVTAFHEEFQIVESMPIGQPLGGTALFFVDSASGDWRTVTAIEGVGMTDVIITSDSIIQAASSLTGVGTVGQLPGEMHPTSAMMLPNPLLLCVIHLLPVSTENVSTQPTWRDLAGVEAPSGLDWIPSDPSSAGPPRESGEQMLVAEFDGGELDGESLVYRVWRLAGTHRPVRTELWGAGGALLTRIDFEYDSGVAEWPRSVEIVEWQDGQAAARSTIEVTSLVLNDPSAFPAQVWTQDFSACASVLDYTSGIVEGRHMDPEQRGGDRSGSGWIRLCGSVGILTVAVGSASVLLAARAVGSPVPPRTAGQSVDAGAQTPAPSHDGHAELMKRLDAKDTSSAAVEALSKASGELLLCPLSEAAFTQLSAADQQKVYDRGAAFRALARSLAATIKQGGAAGDKAKALLKRLATDNSKSTLSKYAQAQGKFASDLLSK